METHQGTNFQQPQSGAPGENPPLPPSGPSSGVINSAGNPAGPAPQPAIPPSAPLPNTSPAPVDPDNMPYVRGDG